MPAAWRPPAAHPTRFGSVLEPSSKRRPKRAQERKKKRVAELEDLIAGAEAKVALLRDALQ
jgi:hypothetical protein